MSDLISRSEVLELLYKIFDKYHMSTDKNTSIGKSFGTDVFKEIKEMPTAYSVDKIVEELELHSFEFGTDTLPAHYVRLNEAIEIVKQGGVSDDVCEWKQDNMCETVYRVCGGFSTTAYQTDFEFCPYCGKKIKVKQNDN